MTTQKKTLLELMLQAGIQWPEGAEYAAQDKDTMRVRFYRKCNPLREFGVDYWSSFGGSLINGVMVKLPEICRNWHKTIVTKAQYEEAVADDPEQPVITDWRDLKVGDVIWWGGDSKHDCGEYTVNGIESEDYAGDCAIHLTCGEWVDVQAEEWRFIRRP